MSTYGSNFFRELINKLDEAPSKIPNLREPAGTPSTGKPNIPNLRTPGGKPAAKPPAAKPPAAKPPAAPAAAPSGLQAKYQALLKTLEQPAADEGFFARNSRRTENAEKLAKFAEDNGLPGMYDPETGNFVTYGEVEDPDTGQFEKKTQIVSFGTMDAAKDLAGKGLLPDVVIQRFTDQLADTSDILGNERPEYRKDLEDIFKAHRAAKGAQKPNAVKTGVDQAELPKRPDDDAGDNTPVDQPPKMPPDDAGDNTPVDEPPKMPPDDAGDNTPADDDPQMPPDDAGDNTPADGGKPVNVVGRIPPSDTPADAPADAADDPMIKDLEKKEKEAKKTSALKQFAASGQGGLRNDPGQVQAIKELQRKLGLTPDGKYGTQTRQAVRKFQTAQGLTADGDAGPQTIARLAQDAGDNVNPLANQPGDYTGADGIEDMETGKFVPPTGAATQSNTKNRAKMNAQRNKTQKSSDDPYDEIMNPLVRSQIESYKPKLRDAVNESYGPDFFKTVKSIFENISAKQSAMQIILEDIALIALDEGPEEIATVSNAIRKLATTGEGKQWLASQGLDINDMSDDDIVNKIVAPMGRGAYKLAGQAQRNVDPKQLGQAVGAADNPLTRLVPGAIAGAIPKGPAYTPGAQGINPSKIDVDISPGDVSTFLSVYDSLKDKFPKAAASLRSGNFQDALAQIYDRMADR